MPMERMVGPLKSSPCPVLTYPNAFGDCVLSDHFTMKVGKTQGIKMLGGGISSGHRVDRGAAGTGEPGRGQDASYFAVPEPISQ